MTETSTTVWELMPGMGDAIQHSIEMGGGLVCEDHPWMPWEDESGNEACCGAAGMIKADAIRNGVLREDGWPLCPICGEDELFSLDNVINPGEDLIKTICGCYRCGWRIQRGRGGSTLSIPAYPSSGPPEPWGSLSKDQVEDGIYKAGRMLRGFNGWVGR